jgi:hypothetical protein
MLDIDCLNAAMYLFILIHAGDIVLNVAYCDLHQDSLWIPVTLVASAVTNDEHASLVAGVTEEAGHTLASTYDWHDSAFTVGGGGGGGGDGDGDSFSFSSSVSTFFSVSPLDMFMTNAMISITTTRPTPM